MAVRDSCQLLQPFPWDLPRRLGTLSERTATTPLAGEEARVAVADCRYGSNPSGQFISGNFQPYPQYPCLSSQPIPFERQARSVVFAASLVGVLQRYNMHFI